MTLSRTNVGNWAGNYDYGTGSFVTGSFTPPANSILLITISRMKDYGGGALGALTTLSGGGLSYTPIAYYSHSSSWGMRCDVYYAEVGSSPSSMTITVDDANSIASWGVNVDAYTGYNTSSRISGLVKTADDVDIGNGAETVTLGAAPATGDVSLYFEMIDADNFPAPTVTDFTKLHDTGQASYGTCTIMERTGSTSTSIAVTDSYTASGTWFKGGYIAFNLKVAAGGAVEETVTLGRTASLSTGSQTNERDAASLARSAGLSITESITGQATEETVSLAYRLYITQRGQEVEETVTLGRSAALSANGTRISIQSSPTIDVGYGYNDGSSQQGGYTSDKRLWLMTKRFDTYPWGDNVDGKQYPLRVYKADQTGVPSSFSLMDNIHAPAAPQSWGMAIGSDDNLHLLWVERASEGNANNLKYCLFNTSTGLYGSVETVDSALNIANEGGQGDDLCAIAIDVDGIPHVAYCKYDTNNVRRIYYRNKIGGSWSGTTLIDTQSYTGTQHCHHPGIVFDRDGRIIVSWIFGSDEGNTDGRAYVRVYNGSWGTVHDISGANMWPGIDTALHIEIDPTNCYHATFLSTAKYIQYWYSDDEGATWSSNHPGSGMIAGDDPLVVSYFGGKFRIYAHSPGSPYKISYFSGSGRSASWGSEQEYSSMNPADCTVGFTWSRYYHHNVDQIAILYWKSTYPSNELYVGVDYLTESIEESISLAIHQGVSGAEQATVQDGLSLARSAGQGGAELAAVGDATSLADSRGITAASQTNEKDAITLARSGGMMVEGGPAYADGVSLARAAGISSAEQPATGEAVSLGRSAGITSVEQLRINESASLGRTDGQNAATQAAVQDAVSLSHAAGLGIDGQKLGGIEESVSLARWAGVTNNTQIQAGETISVAISAGTISLSQVSVNNEISLSAAMLIAAVEMIPSAGEMKNFIYYAQMRK